MVVDRKEPCPIRHPENGNCLCVGGFCTAVPDAVCEGLRSAYDSGVHDVAVLARKHGRWIYYPNGSWEKKDVYKCSCCGNYQDFVIFYHFCPFCGARMDLPKQVWFRGREMTPEEWAKEAQNKDSQAD